jgi:hypothetical protein
MNGRIRLALMAALLAALACSLPIPATPPGSPTTPTLAGPGPTEGATPPASEAPAPPAATPTPRIVYTDAGNLWALEEDGSSHQVTFDGGASDVYLSDDGERLAYVWRSDPAGHGELRAVDADGGATTVLLTAAQLDALYPIAEGTVGTDLSQIAFLPGTHRLVFNTYLIPEFMGFSKHDDLWMIDTETAELISLLPAGDGGDFAIAPDGSQMAVIRPTSVSAVNADGTNYRPDLITFPWVITYSEFLFYPLAVWNPESTALVASIPSEDPLADSAGGTLWRIPAGAGPATPLATIPGGFYFHFWRSPAVSPDLTRVAFTRHAGADDEDLYLAQVDGTGEVIYTTGDVDWAGWAPDSNHFAFTLGTPSDLMIGAPGEPPTPIGSGTRFRWVSATEYLFLAGTGGSWTLTRGTIGGPPETLVSPAGDPVSYDFSP